MFNSSEESRLFDMYRLYLNKKIDRQSFIDVYHYDNFDRAEALYKKIMG